MGIKIEFLRYTVRSRADSTIERKDTTDKVMMTMILVVILLIDEQEQVESSFNQAEQKKN